MSRNKINEEIREKQNKGLTSMFTNSAIILIAFFLSFSFVVAQESVNSAGGNASAIGGSVSYSVGQIVYSTNTGSNGSEIQGVQQPFEISVVTELEEANGIILSVTAYPNPTNDYLTLNIDEYVQIRHALSHLSYQLYDMNGKLLQNKKLIEAVTQIDMKNFVLSTYFLKIINNNKEVKTFKIVKL